MSVTKRQEQILNKLIQDYIDSAEPISSEFLEEKHNFGVSPATIRIEMQKLTDFGYLFQPHTSSGRVPTDKGYRFFVNDLFKRGFRDFEDKKFFEEIEKIEREVENSLRFSQEITKTLANFSSNVALGYFSDEKILWREGWLKVFEEPEFKNPNFLKNFAGMVDQFERKIENFAFNGQIKVYIGEENPIPKAKDFSLIISKHKLPKGKKGTLAILGPKRMDYDRNISIMDSLIKMLENF